jgi:hypothetical protein
MIQRALYGVAKGAGILMRGKQKASARLLAEAHSKVSPSPRTVTPLMPCHGSLNATFIARVKVATFLIASH